MEDILLAQLSSHPHSEARDLIKLLYQMEFGCEHLLKDVKTAAKYLNEEMDGNTEPLNGEPLYESIGEGLCRLNLRPAAGKLTREEILSLFTECAAEKRGTKEHFLSRVHEAVSMAEEERIPFDPVEIEIFMAGYDEKRCAPLHHSEQYRSLYHPSYRLVLQHRLKALLKKKRQ